MSSSHSVNVAATVAPPVPSTSSHCTTPPLVDVFIVGAGPAGLMASLCNNTYGLKVMHIDERPHPTTAGRADGIQPRTIEVLRNIGAVTENDEPGDLDSQAAPLTGGGLAKKMISQGVRVYEVAFWDPTDDKDLARTSRAPSCPDFIDVVDNYTLLLHQGRIEHAFLEEIEKRRRRLPTGVAVSSPQGGVLRPYKVVSCRTLPQSDLGDYPLHPVEIVIAHATTGAETVVRSKYLLGCDGARSSVRRSIAGGEEGDGEWKGKITMQGEATDIRWGVMDAHIKTDFPDLKFKCLLHSRNAGSIMVIPRENNLVRFYVQLQAGEDGSGKHIERDAATLELCQERARKIFHPFKLEFGYVDWFSVYQIGQRIASNYTLDGRILLGGDATHTHSPKAGQGMNISMLDMYSLAWKINLIEKGIGNREILIPTYEQERRGVAQELLAFDAEYSKMFSGKNPKLDEMTADSTKAKSAGKSAVDAQKFIEVFKKNAFFTSGCGAVYFANALNALPDSPLLSSSSHSKAISPAGLHLVPGQRLLPGRVTRAQDANQVRIQQEVVMNGAFRIHVMAGCLGRNGAKLEKFAKWLESAQSFYNLYRPRQGVHSSIVDGQRAGKVHLETISPNTKDTDKLPPNPFFTFLTIVATPRYEWEIEDLPWALRRYRDQVYGDDLFDRRVPHAGEDAPLHTKYGIDKKDGGLIVVRPDGYVGIVTEFSEEGWLAINDYFAGFLNQATPAARL